MNMKWVVPVFALILVSVRREFAAAIGQCNHICDLHGELSQTYWYCTQNNIGDPLGVRICCLSQKFCPEEYCTDYGNVTIVAVNYNLFEIALDLDQICDCAVVDCVEYEGEGCTPCSPPSLLLQSGQTQQKRAEEMSSLQ